MLRWLGCAVVLFAGCFNPVYDDVRCGTDKACPSGLRCDSASGFCEPPGSGVGGSDAGIGPGTDATPTTGADAGASACKVLTSFKTNAQPVLRDSVMGAASCVSCHGGSNTVATAAMDLTKITATVDADILLACDQVRSRINFQTPDQSGVYLAPTPGGTSHPLKFNAAQLTTFKTDMDVWVNAELTAP